MKNLAYPQIDNMELWDRIVSNKQRTARGKLLTIRNSIAERYTFYETHFNSLDEVLPLPQAEWKDVKDELISCYGGNVEFQKVRHKIFDALSASNQTKCPYCLLNRPNTLDHYFDKTDYPEFSVFVPNLIPCCSECNNAKSTSVFDPQNKRKHIHFYHDPIPVDQFLFIRFSFAALDAVPLVSISLSFSEENCCSERIRKHFDGLSLIAKYRGEVLDRLAPLLEEIKMHLLSGLSMENIITALQNRYTSLVKQYGNNYWETCIYEGVLNSPDFLSLYFSRIKHS